MKKSINILLVEDNELDVRMIQNSAKKTKLHNSIHVVYDAGAALEQLRSSRTEDLPDLILLDLSLPGISGLEFLGLIKDDKALRSIPVVVLTSSAADKDIKQAYENQAAAFITKPIEVDGFKEIVLTIDKFFFDIVTLAEHR
ncbi:MAG: response regulator [Granulosicoccus sp.]